MDLLAGVLVADSPRAWAGLGEPPSGFRIVESLAVLPGARAPRLLVPTSSSRAGATSLRQFNQGMTQGARLRKAAIGAAFRTGAWRLTKRDRMTVALAPDVLPSDWSELFLGAHLRELLEIEALTFSVSLGPLRANIKPVLQLLTPSGRAVAYAKLGWNRLTSRIVSHEASVLRGWKEHPPSTFDVPDLVRTSTWSGRDVIVTSPVPHPLVRRGRFNTPVPLDVYAEIAARGGTETAPLAARAYWPALRARVDEVTDRSRGSRVAAILDRIEAVHGAAELAFGTWHGDLAPGNTSLVDGRLHIWDWERSATGVPVGLDPIHFHYQLAAFANGRNVPAAVGRGLEGASATLEALGIPRVRHRMLASVYLLERYVRYQEGRSEGTLGSGDATIDDILTVLEEER
jgi:hypothetical protein